MAEGNLITITIGEQVLRVRAEAGERERFERAARRVNKILDELSAGGVVGGPRLMAMVAFELAVTLEETREQVDQSRVGQEESRRRLDQIIKRIESRIEIVGEEPPAGARRKKA